MVRGYASLVRGRRVLILLFIISCLYSLLYLGGFVYQLVEGDLALSIFSPGSLEDAAGVEKGIRVSPWAQENECGVGKWVPRTPLYSSVEDYQAVNRHKSGWIWGGCNVFNDSGIQDKDLKKKLQAERLVELSNWVWQPSRGALAPFDAVDFVVRLVKSPGGLVMFGDSIARQHHDNLFVTLLKHEIYHDSDVPYLPKYNHITQYVLRPGTPMTKVILQRSGVPESRLKQPFLTFIEDHMILPPEDIMRISNAPEGYEWPFAEDTHPFVLGLTDLLTEMAKPVPEEEETVMKDTIFLFNTGPHWSRSRLPVPRSTYAQEREEMCDIYLRMMDLISSRLKPIARTLIFYRSTSPPHPHCEAHSSPYLDLYTAQVAEANIFGKQVEGLDLQWRRTKGRWDWDLFETYNEFWKEKVQELAVGSVKEKRRQRWYYLDIWGLSLQRPDAHAEPEKDCLHYCMPTVYTEWTQQLYHRLFLLGELSGPS